MRRAMLASLMLTATPTIMSIMTSMPWSDHSSEVVTAIAKALYDTRATLA